MSYRPVLPPEPPEAFPWNVKPPPHSSWWRHIWENVLGTRKNSELYPYISHDGTCTKFRAFPSMLILALDWKNVNNDQYFLAWLRNQLNEGRVSIGLYHSAVLQHMERLIAVQLEGNFNLHLMGRFCFKTDFSRTATLNEKSKRVIFICLIISYRMDIILYF